MSAWSQTRTRLAIHLSHVIDQHGGRDMGSLWHLYVRTIVVVLRLGDKVGR